MHPRSRELDRYPILRFFDNEHLSGELKSVSQTFKVVAYQMAQDLPYHPETSAGLRKLLEAKDCAVRAALSALEPADE